MCTTGMLLHTFKHTSKTFFSLICDYHEMNFESSHSESDRKLKNMPGYSPEKQQWLPCTALSADIFREVLLLHANITNE